MNCRRLLVHVEGPTEETFVNEVLAMHLLAKGYEKVDARLLGNARLRSHRGGICSWSSARRDVVKHLRQDQRCLATTLVDYYGLPQTGEGAWPGRAQASSQGTPSEKALCVEHALVENLAQDIDARRFIPFVIMHEFEGWLFSDVSAFSRGIGRPDLERKFGAIRNSFNTPEHINDSLTNAPSKRIQNLVPSYQKPLYGVLAILEIGMARIREECPQFAGWLKRLESLVGSEI